MNSDIRLGTYGGVRVGASWSVFVVVALLAWSLATAILPDEVAGLAVATYWVGGTVAAVLFLLSITLHELAHSIVANRRGLVVREITLWMFGGVSKIEGDAPTAGVEALVAAVGPLTSYLLAGLALAAAVALTAAGAPAIAVAVCAWLAVINAVLATFNLLPAFPLDGGRLLRALIWRLTGDKHRATGLAARAGRGFGGLMVAIGLAEMVLMGALVSGLWTVVLGWYLRGAASAEEGGEELQERLRGVRVEQVMTASPVTVSGGLTADDFVENLHLHPAFTSFPVVDEEGRPQALVRLRDVLAVPPAERPTTLLATLAQPLGSVATAGPSEPLLDVMRRVDGRGDARVMVLDEGRLVGILSPRDIARAAGRGRPASGGL